MVSLSILTGLLTLSSYSSASVIPHINNPQAQAILAHHDTGSLPNTPSPDEINTHTRPSWFTSTLLARRMLAHTSSGVIATVFPDPIPPSTHAPTSVAGLPIGLKEYIADCDPSLPNPHQGDNGNPTILALRVATSFKNIAAGSNLSLELDWWNHLSESGPVYPGLPESPAALPRVTLFGYLENLSDLGDAVKEDLEKCFLASHPDARAWLPGVPGSPHSSFWARLVVTHAYWIGGFGDVQQIGWLNMSEWKGIRREGSLSGIGDGRGWADVRLPGEKK